MGQLNCFTASHSWQFIIQIQKGSIYTKLVVLYKKDSVQMYVYSINTVFGFAHVSVCVCVYMAGDVTEFVLWVLVVVLCDIKQCDSQIKTRQKIY